jgi:hypothetical protein
MGSIWEVRAGGRQLMWGKNVVPDALMLLFTDADRQIDLELIEKINAAWEEDTPLDGPARPLLWYTCGAGSMKKRLALQGFGLQAVIDRAVAYVAEIRANPNLYMPDEWEEIQSGFTSAAAEFSAWMRWRWAQLRRRTGAMDGNERSAPWAPGRGSGRSVRRRSPRSLT